MERDRTLWLALGRRAALAGTDVLPAEAVRTTAAEVGVDETALLATMERLSGQKRVRLEWGGGVRVLEPEPQAAPSGGGPVLSGPIHGPVVFSSGPNARFDQRAAGSGNTYNETAASPTDLEAILADLAAAAAALRERAPVLPTAEAAEVTAAANTAAEVARDGGAGSADRLKELAERVETVGQLQNAVAKLGPAWTLLSAAATAAAAYFGLGG